MNKERLTLRDLQNSKEMFVSAKVAAEVMCIGYKNFLIWLDRGEFPEIKRKRINGRWMIYRLQLIQYIITGSGDSPRKETERYDYSKRIL